VASKPVPSSSAPDLLGRALLPLRAFLGFTFCFAGLQKLANPRFFDAADPASIQSQLAGAARRSPVHALISPLTHVAVPLGVLIAFGELAVGVGTLLGLRARLAATGGLALSLMLFLTVSFHSAPYYTGADIVFAFAWTPLVLAGSGSVLSLDATIASFTDPASGDPSIVIRPDSRRFVAFDAVCPHAGCTVGYDPGQKVIICPCHGSQFNAGTGAVEVGPATTGLKKLRIAEGPNGQLYVT
jgi:nitrite reductase/ring-hydroxylating ferredoxin subunit